MITLIYIYPFAHKHLMCVCGGGGGGRDLQEMGMCHKKHAGSFMDIRITFQIFEFPSVVRELKPYDKHVNLYNS